MRWKGFGACNASRVSTRFNPPRRSQLANHEESFEQKFKRYRLAIFAPHVSSFASCVSRRNDGATLEHPESSRNIHLFSVAQFSVIVKIVLLCHFSIVVRIALRRRDSFSLSRRLLQVHIQSHSTLIDPWNHCILVCCSSMWFPNKWANWHLTCLFQRYTGCVFNMETRKVRFLHRHHFLCQYMCAHACEFSNSITDIYGTNDLWNRRYGIASGGLFESQLEHFEDVRRSPAVRRIRVPFWSILVAWFVFMGGTRFAEWYPLRVVNSWDIGLVCQKQGNLKISGRRDRCTLIIIYKLFSLFFHFNFI